MKRCSFFEKIIETKYTKDINYEEFIKDRLTVDAVLRNFDIINEEQRMLPEEFKAQHSGIDWHQIGEFKNTIQIDYFDIDFSSVWHIKNTFLPPLILQLKQINL